MLQVAMYPTPPAVFPTNSIKIVEGIAKLSYSACIESNACIESCPQDAIREISSTFKFAIGTDENNIVKFNDYFGNSKQFLIWQFEEGSINFIEKRKNPKYAEDESYTHGDPGKAKAVKSALTDIDVIIAHMFGPNIKRLRDTYVCAVSRSTTIEETVEKIKNNINEIIEESEKSKRKGIVLYV